MAGVFLSFSEKASDDIPKRQGRICLAWKLTRATKGEPLKRRREMEVRPKINNEGAISGTAAMEEKEEERLTRGV